MVCWNGAAGKCKGHHTFTRDEKPVDSQWQDDRRDFKCAGIIHQTRPCDTKLDANNK